MQNMDVLLSVDFILQYFVILILGYIHSYDIHSTFPGQKSIDITH